MDDVLSHAREHQDQVFDDIDRLARWQERHGLDPTPLNLALAHIAYIHGNTFGLRDAVAFCGAQRPLPAWASAALLRILDGLIEELSGGPGHSTIKNRLNEFHIQFACWEALQSARKRGLKGDRADAAAAEALAAQGHHLTVDTIKKYHQTVARQRRRTPGRYYRQRSAK